MTLRDDPYGQVGTVGPYLWFLSCIYMHLGSLVLFSVFNFFWIIWRADCGVSSKLAAFGGELERVVVAGLPCCH